jgi:ribonuclease HI
LSIVKIYTDGACSGNPGAGGWAAVLIYNENEKEISGFEADTTNNRMELLACVKSLQELKKNNFKVEVYSDSSYLVNAINQDWIANWQKNGWKTSAKEIVKNQDLWNEIIKLNAVYKPTYIKVKGHADNKYNNRCDELAVGEIKKRKKQD